MQQTFYIDSDEEISSVIERLRKSLAAENFFVLSKRSLVMQSVVNLKLLKREADKLRKKIIIVTQDEIGANMAARAGLSVRSSVEEIENREFPTSQKMGGGNFWEDQAEYFDEGKNDRLKDVGSNGFYEIHKSADLQNEKNHQKDVKHVSHKKITISEKTKHKAQNPAKIFLTNHQKTNLDPYKEEVLEKMYAKAESKKRKELNIPLRSRTKKMLTLFVLLCIGAFLGTAVYLFVPKANIVVTLNMEKNKVDADVLGLEGGSSSLGELDGLPIQILREEQEISFDYDSTGQANSATAKAHGKVAIYNQYSNQPQVLVATTRVESADGKIFRLVRNETVPGITEVGGETKPGVVEVEVVADEAGENYNIEPTTFSIPGFKDSPKFEKFSGKSTAIMTGGGSSGGSVKNLSARDLENAKKETEQKLKEKLKGIIEAKIGSEDVFLDEATRFVVSESNADAKIGALQNSFKYHAKGELAVMIFQARMRKRF